MPSLLSTIVRGQIKLLSPLIGGASLERTRRAQDNLGKLGTRALEGSVRFKPRPFSHFDASWAIPLKGRVTQAILYLHGGAYTAGGLDYAQGFGGLLAQRTGRAVMCVGYRLAPEDPFPAALEDALACYRYMLERYEPEDIAFVGESAGGGLCYSLALRARELGLPQPSRIVAISPWTDLTMERDVSDVQGKDPLLSRDALLEFAGMYAGQHSLRDPLISPLFGDLKGIAPSLLFVGTAEILLDDALLMQARLLGAGCECEVHVEEGLWHVYVLYGVPESRHAMSMIEAYLRGGAEALAQAEQDDTA